MGNRRHGLHAAICPPNQQRGKMSREAENYAMRVCDEKDVARRPRLIMRAIASFMHQNSPEQVCFVGQAKLATYACIEVRTLKTHLQALETAGLITRVRCPRYGRHGGRKTDQIRIVGWGIEGVEIAPSKTHSKVQKTVPFEGANFGRTHNRRTNGKKKPPHPQPPNPGFSAKGVGVEKLGIGSAETIEGRCLAELRAAGGYTATIDGLIAPIINARPVKGTPDPLAALADIARRWHTLPPVVLEAAVERCLEARGDHVRASDIDAAARWAEQQHALASARSAPVPSARSATHDPGWLAPGTPALVAYIAESPLDVNGKPRDPNRGVRVSPGEAARLAGGNVVPLKRGTA
jgi:hypothetical protein